MSIFKFSQARHVPFAPLRVDWKHPLTNGLIGCWVPGAAGFNNLGSAPLTLNRQTNTKFGISAHGPSLYAPEGTSVAIYAGAPNEFKVWTGFSIFYCGMRIGTLGAVNAENIYLSVSYDNLNSGPYYVVGYGVNSSGLRSLWNTGGTLRVVDGVIGTVPALNTMYTAGSTFPVGGTVYQYENGIQQAVSGAFGTSAPTSTSTSTLAIHAPGSDLTRKMVHSSNIICCWNRALTAAEMAWLDRDPYGFLIPALDEPVPLFVPSTVALSQSHFRFRTDTNAVDATPTWGDAEDAA